MTELSGNAPTSANAPLCPSQHSITALVRLRPELKEILSAWQPLAEHIGEEQRQIALASACSVAELNADPNSVLSALTFDAYRACREQAKSVAALCPELSRALDADKDLPTLLDGVEKLEAIRWDQLDAAAAESLRAMFLALSKDVRALLVVLARRLHMLRNLRRSTNHHSAKTAKRLAQETLEIHAPLTNRLGIGQWKWELEDHSLALLQPTTYRELTNLLNEKRTEREKYVDTAVSELQQLLKANGLAATVKGRPKHIYSIYKKMERKQVGFDEVYDIIALRVIAKTVQDCYAILGTAHSRWTPIPSEFDDYVAMPKGNGYQSLHTVVIGPQGKAVEIQIRTEEMDRFAELGVAAHWAYKENSTGKQLAAGKFLLLRQLLDWDQELQDPTQFAETLKTDLFEDQVYVFTPKGDVVALPKGATGLDFAYRVHTAVGHRCKGVRVNEQIVPLTRALKTGERVRVLTRAEPSPSRDWMHETNGFLRTSSGRSKVRQWFRQQDRQTAIAEGTEILQRELSRLDVENVPQATLAQKLGYSGPEELLAAVGYGDRSAASVGASAVELERQRQAKDVSSVLDQLPPEEPAKRVPQRTSGVTLDHVDDVLGSRARCCNPVPGDDVLGFITRGRGMIIHRADCANVTGSLEPVTFAQSAR